MSTLTTSVPPKFLSRVSIEVFALIRVSLQKKLSFEPFLLSISAYQLLLGTLNLRAGFSTSPANLLHHSLSVLPQHLLPLNIASLKSTQFPLPGQFSGF